MNTVWKIAGGRLVDPDSGSVFLGDLWIADGRLYDTAPKGATTVVRELDARGKVVVPGCRDEVYRVLEIRLTGWRNYSIVCRVLAGRTYLMSVMIEFEVSRDILESARITPAEALVELAVVLYAERRLSVGKACELAHMPLWRFRQLLATREVAAHYDTGDVDDDRMAIRELGMA